MPDALSRLPLPNDGEEADGTARDPLTAQLVKLTRPKGISLEEIDVATLEDELLALVKQFVLKGWPHKSKIKPDVLPYYQV